MHDYEIETVSPRLNMRMRKEYIDGLVMKTASHQRYAHLVELLLGRFVSAASGANVSSETVMQSSD